MLCTQLVVPSTTTIQLTKQRNSRHLAYLQLAVVSSFLKISTWGEGCPPIYRPTRRQCLTDWLFAAPVGRNAYDYDMLTRTSSRISIHADLYTHDISPVTETCATFYSCKSLSVFFDPVHFIDWPLQRQVTSRSQKHANETTRNGSSILNYESQQGVQTQ